MVRGNPRLSMFVCTSFVLPLYAFFPYSYAYRFLGTRREPFSININCKSRIDTPIPLGIAQILSVLDSAGQIPILPHKVRKTETGYPTVVIAI